MASVGIFGLMDLAKRGGLETYVHSLRTELLERGIDVTWNGLSDFQSAAIAESWQRRQRYLLPLMTRAFTRRIVKYVAQSLGQRWSSRLPTSLNVVHYVGTGWNLMGFALAAWAKKNRKPMSCWPAIHPATWGDSPLDIELYRQLPTIFVQSDFEAKYLLSLGISREQLVRCGCAVNLPDGVNLPAEELRCKIGASRDTIVVLFLGRRCKEKGYHNLRAAVRQLIADGADIKLVSVGRVIETSCPALPADRDIDLGIASEDLKNVSLAACDVFALPSATESFGISYVEAWSHMKPVVCGPAPASTELVERHRGGLKTDGTVESVVDSIKLLAKNEKLRRELGNNGYAAVVQNYTPQAIVGIHLNAWQLS